MMPHFQREPFNVPDPEEGVESEKPMKPELLHYSMSIQWSEEDQAYIVTVPELPGCRSHGKTYVDAVVQGQDAIESWIEANKAWGRPIPAPRTATPA